MQILALLGIYIDAVVVFVTSQTLLFRLALAILCSWSYKTAKLGVFYAQNVVRQKFTNFFFTKNTAPKHEEVDKR